MFFIIWAWSFCLLFETSALQSKLGQVNLQMEQQSFPYAQALTSQVQLWGQRLHISVQVTSENKSVSTKIMDELNAFLQNITLKSYELTFNKFGGEKYSHQLTFLHGYESFLKVFENLRTQLRRHDVQHFICLFARPGNKSYDIMEKTMQRLFEANIVSVIVFMREPNDTISAYMLRAYTSGRCHEVNPLFVNRFIDGRPEGAMNYLKPCRKLHGCTFKVYSPNMTLFLGFPHKALEEEQTTDYFGFEAELLRVLAKLLNFSVRFVEPEQAIWGEVFGESNMTGPFKMLHTGEVDIHMGGAVYTPNRVKYFDASNSYHMNDQIVILRKRCFQHKYAEWVLDPFAKTTWIWLQVLFLVLVVSSLVSTPAGEKVEALLCILAVVLGAPIKLEKKSSLRLSLYFTIKVGCFVLRSAYVGKVYDSYSQRHCEQPPATISDLILKNFTILTRTDYTDLYTNRTILKNYDPTQRQSIFDYWSSLEEPHNVAAISNYGVFINYLISGNSFRSYMTVPQPIGKHQLCIYFRKHSCLVEPFNEIIGKLITSGLMAKWQSQYNFDESWRRKFRELMAASPEPVPVTLEKMRYVFFLLVLNLTIAIFVFLLEVFYVPCKRRLAALRWLRKFF